MTDAPTWAAPTPLGPVDARVRVPGSKSLTNRWLVLAALAGGASTLRHPLRSRDSERMVAALAGLGAQVEDTDDAVWTITPPAAFRGGVDIDCGQAGTVMRFVPPLAGLADAPVRFDGHPSARTRPVGPVLEALRSLGVQVHDGGDHPGRGTLPFTVVGIGSGRGEASTRPVPSGSAEVPVASAMPVVPIDASASSQFVSALLLAGAAYPHGLRLEHVGREVPSLPHIEMTLESLAQVGVSVERPDERTWVVHPGSIRPFDVTIEPDLSSAAPFLGLAAATGGHVLIPDWPTRTTQPGDRMRQILEAMGAATELTADGLVATGAADGRLRGVELDLSQVGELTPVVAALAALAQGPSRLRGIGHLRGHETDRLAALVAELTRLGARARETDDGLEVDPGPLRPARLETYHDHRMAMFAALVGARVRGVQVVDVATADKTFPRFDSVWEHAVGTGAPAQAGSR